MSVPVVEIITFTASEALLADDSRLNGTIDYLKKADGSISVLHGYQTEDPSRIYIFIAWKTFEHFEKAIASETFPAFRDNFQTHLVGGDFSMRHILFDVNAISALSAPITEICTCTPKEGQDQSEIDALIHQLQGNTHLFPGVHPSPAWGKVKQNSEHIFVIGWDSLEAKRSSSKIPWVQEVVEGLVKISEFSVKHVVLHKA